jgi:hypothetical protein
MSTKEFRGSGRLTLDPMGGPGDRQSIPNGFVANLRVGELIAGAKLTWQGPAHLQMGTSIDVDLRFLAPDFAATFVQVGRHIDVCEAVTRIGSVEVISTREE